jgi:hypothetical protein
MRLSHHFSKRNFYLLIRRRIFFILLFLGMPLTSFANGVNMHISGGAGLTQFNHTDNLFLNRFVENSYSESSDSTSSSFVSVGAGYQWNNLFARLPQIAVNFGASAYFTNYNLSGTNSPFINIGHFDTLSYYTKDSSYALLFEPKIIYERYQLQPYLLGGLGVAWNKMSNYSETPTNSLLSAVPMPKPFTNRTTANVAYELGLGMQTSVYKIKDKGNLAFFADYRFMDWGKMQLGASPLQTTAHGPYLGYLKTQLFSVGLEFQFD